MKTKIFLPILLVAAALSGAGAQKRVVILGDRTCAGSADSTIVSVNAPAKAYTYPYGLFGRLEGCQAAGALTPYKATRDDNFGAQTMVDGLHATLAKNLPGESEFVYTIISDDRPIAQWDFASLVPEADYVVWMHGSLEYATSEADYASGLRRLVARYPGARIVFVQPGNGGAVFASRTAAEEYSVPSFTVENAMIGVARTESHDAGISVVNPHGVEYGTDGRTPRASSMSRLGTQVGAALTVEKPAAFNPFCVARGNYIRIGGLTTSMLDTVSVAPAPAYGFEVWRGQQCPAAQSRALYDGRCHRVQRQRTSGGRRPPCLWHYRCRFGTDERTAWQFCTFGRRNASFFD